MQKNKEISHSMVSTITISTILIASFILSGSQFSQQALAIHEGNATTATTQNQLTGGNNTTTTGPTAQSQASVADGAPTQGATDSTQSPAVPGGNATDTGAASTPAQTPAPSAATQEPPVNQNFVRQGTVASSPAQIGGPEGQNLAFILPPRSDGGVYSGVLTYTASKPVGVAVLHNYDPQNSTAIPEEYGTELTSPLPGGDGNVAITLFQPPYESGVNAASVPFTGSALALHTTEEGPFTATFTVNAFATQSEDANAPLEFVAEEGEVEEAAADEDEEEAAADEDEEGAAADEDEEEAAAE